MHKSCCFLLHDSDGYNAENMQYEWENRTDKGVAVNKKLDDMPQYNLTGTSTKRYFTMYYSGMQIRFCFKLLLHHLESFKDHFLHISNDTIYYEEGKD